MKQSKRRRKTRKQAKSAAAPKKSKTDLLFEFGKRSSRIATGLIQPEKEPKIPLNPEDMNIDFNLPLFKSILKAALFDKDTDKIIIWLPRAGAKKLFESYIKKRTAHLEAQIERAETLDDLTEVAGKVKNAKLAITEEAVELFAQEKLRLLKLIEDKFGGTVQLA